jgi:hypothetical protein
MKAIEKTLMEELSKKIEMLRDMLISHATGGRADGDCGKEMELIRFGIQIPDEL